MDDLKTFLNLSKKFFDTICIPETRIRKGVTPTVNIELQGYTIEQTQTESKAGGTLIYIFNKLNYNLRNDLKIYKTIELESTFIEIS